jgi:hypothetical protein
LHIGAYHSQINNQKEEEKQRINISEKLRKPRENSRKKQLFYLKKEKIGNIYISSTQKTHAKFEDLKDESNQN